MKFNYNKLDAEGNPDTNWNTAIANLAFRKSLYYGLDLESYYAAIRSGNLATNRGYLLNDDDRLRAKVIMELMCQFKVVKVDIEKKFGINFNEYFDFELNNLKHFEAEGLVRLEPDYIEVTPKGKLLVRAVAMNFDRYLREDERVRRYSRIV